MCLLYFRLCQATKMHKSCSLLSKSSWFYKGEKHKEKVPFNVKTAIVTTPKKPCEKLERKKLAGREEIRRK